MKLPIGIAIATCLAACGSNTDHGTESDVPTEDTLASLYTPADMENFADMVLKLHGEWESVQDSGRTVFNEQWQRTDDRFFSGLGFVMSGKDTAFVEHLSIHWDSIPVYSARTASQNNGEYVAFTLRPRCAPGTMVFENPTHDWPQSLSYTKAVDGWDVVVGGGEKGVLREEHYHFVPRGKPVASPQ